MDSHLTKYYKKIYSETYKIIFQIVIFLCHALDKANSNQDLSSRQPSLLVILYFLHAHYFLAPFPTMVAEMGLRQLP